MARYLEVITRNYIDSIAELMNICDAQEVNDLLVKVQSAGFGNQLFKIIQSESSSWESEELCEFLENNKVSILHELGLLKEDDPFYDLIKASELFVEDDVAEVEEGDWSLVYNEATDNVEVYYKGKLALTISYWRHTIEYGENVGIPHSQIASALGVGKFYRK